MERGFLAILNEAYNKETLAGGKERVVLSFKPHLAPIKAAVIPLKRNNDELVKKSKKIKNSLQSLQLGRVLLENSGNIGKSYRRHDEIGTPLCVTVDFQTLDDNTVTIRDRDTMEQTRIDAKDLASYYQNYLLT